MKRKSTDMLIDDLAGKLDRKVTCLRHPLLRFALWGTAALAYTIALILILGVRPDFSSILFTGVYAFEVSMGLFIALSGGIATAWMAVPDMRGVRWLPAVPLTAGAVFLLWNVLKFFTEAQDLSLTPFGHCYTDGALFGMMPAATLILMMRKGATTMPRMMCAMNMLAVTGLGYVALRITCGNDSVIHGGLIHILPFIGIAAVLGLISRKVYAW